MFNDFGLFDGVAHSVDYQDGEDNKNDGHFTSSSTKTIYHNTYNGDGKPVHRVIKVQTKRKFDTLSIVARWIDGVEVVSYPGIPTGSTMQTSGKEALGTVVSVISVSEFKKGYASI